MTDLKRCSKCVLPETHETIVFDAKDGVCNICKNIEYKQTNIDWEAKKAELRVLVEPYRGKGAYDCVVPFSGGKDSTWTLYYLVTELKVKPLVVRFDHGFFRGGVRRNADKTFRKLGVDVHQFTPNWKVVQKLMLQSFLEKGDFCWHCHTGIFAYPMRVALQQQVPLIVWGEPSSEYTAYYSYENAEEVDEKRFNRYTNLGISAEDMLVRFEGQLEERDLQPFSYPALNDLKKLGVRSVCLGSYVPWDVKRQVEVIQRELGWEGDQVENVPPGYGYEKIECYMQGVRDYIKYLKRGYTRPTHLASIDIRNQRMTREAALSLVRQYEGKRPPSLDIFLDFVGLSEEEFLQICLAHRVSPHQPNLERIEPGEETSDFSSWNRTGAMSRSDCESQLSRSKRRT